MKVSLKAAANVRLPNYNTGGYFFDGFGLSLPPRPNSVTNGAYKNPSQSNIEPNTNAAGQDFRDWAGNNLIYFVVQRNTNAWLEWGGAGALADGQWHDYEYDVSSYSPGESPILLWYGIRSHGADCSKVWTMYSYNAAALGMSVKIAPKITFSVTEGGIASHESGEKYYTYDTASDTYSWIPEQGYKIKDVLIDGTSYGSITSYSFDKVTSNHTINVEFERITADIVYDMNAPSENVEGEMPTETYDSTNTSIPIKDCNYIYKGHKFTGWNTKPDGSGENISPRDSVPFPNEENNEIILYAQWDEVWHDVQWIDALTKEVVKVERVMDGYNASEIPSPVHEGYHLTSVKIIEAQEIVLDENLQEEYLIPSQYTSNIRTQTTYIFNYEPTLYAITVQYQNINTDRLITSSTEYTNAFKEWKADIYPSEVENFKGNYLPLPENAKIIDTDSKEEILIDTLAEIIYNDDGEPSEIFIKSTPTHNITVVLYYDTWIQMPNTGTNGNMLLTLLAISLIITGCFLVSRSKRDNKNPFPTQK